jgi:uncharacterized membrane protein
MKRPVGITILAVIAVIYGIFNLLLALLGLLGSALLASHVAAAAIKYSAGTLAYATISDAILGILFLAFGIGAFRLKGWAWTTGVAGLVLEVVRQIVGVVMQGFIAGTIVRDSITVVIALLLLWYLFRQDVRAAFGKAA